LHALEVLVAVRAEGSISGAAKSLTVAQPTVSAAIARLERDVGRMLIRRDPSGSTLTTEGIMVAAWAEELLDASDVFEARVNQWKGGVGAHLTVAASLTIAEYLLPNWLTAWRKRLTGTAPAGDSPQIELFVQNSTTVIESVLAGYAEIGFIESPVKRLLGLRERVIGRDRLLLVVGPEHAWAGRTEPVSAEELAHSDLLLREHGSGTLDVFVSAMQEKGYEVATPVSRYSSISASKWALLDNTSATVISRLAVRQELQSGQLYAPPTELNLVRELRVIGRVNESLSPSATMLFQVIEESDRQADSAPID